MTLLAAAAAAARALPGAQVPSKSSDAFDIASMYLNLQMRLILLPRVGAAQSLEQLRVWSSAKPGAAQSLVRRKDAKPGAAQRRKRKAWRGAKTQRSKRKRGKKERLFDTDLPRVYCGFRYGFALRRKDAERKKAAAAKPKPKPKPAHLFYSHYAHVGGELNEDSPA